MAYTLDRPMLQEGGSDNLALGLKVFSGEVLQQFRETNVMRPLITTRTIPYGKVASFPVLGKAKAFVHSPGTNILGDGVTAPSSTAPSTASAITQKFSHNERLIYVDQKLIAPTLIPDIEEMINHYELRSRYAGELGAAVSYVYDKAAILSGIVGARILAANAQLVSGEPGGGLGGGGGSIAVGTTPTGDAIIAALYSAAQRFDEIDIPKTGRRCLLPPQAIYALIRDPSIYAMLQTGATAAQVQRVTAFSTNIATQTGTSNAGLEMNGGSLPLMYGAASFVNGSVGRILGFDIISTNHLPSTDLTSGTNFWEALSMSGQAGSNGNLYAIDCSGTTTLATKGLIMHESGVGGLQVRDISVSSEWREDFQATFMLAKMITGFSWLRPSSCIELTATARSDA